MAGRRLSMLERAQIEVLWSEGLSIPQIGARLGRCRTVIWREIARNNSYRCAGVARSPQGRRQHGTVGRGGLYRWGYEARFAQRKADRRAKRPKVRKLVPAYGQPRPALGEVVRAKLRQRWSPQQISAWLACTYPTRAEMQVSHETIYQAIYLQGRGSLRAEIARQEALRSGRVMRRAQGRAASAARSRRAWTQGFHISSRPAQVADRAVPGHWEGDLVIGARGASAIITLVERRTRFVMLGALPQARTSNEVIEVLTTLMGRLPQQLRRTLTWDNGIEMRHHATFTLATGSQVYFCDPHSPWQRGTNENTNGLLRQYFPRSSTNFRNWSQPDLDDIAAQLNNRPRQTLNWQTPAERLNELLVAPTT